MSLNLVSDKVISNQIYCAGIKAYLKSLCIAGMVNKSRFGLVEIQCLTFVGKDFGSE